MESVDMYPQEFKDKRRAIVCFGPATPTTGFKAGDYYQVTIDPNMRSPKGDYIRCGAYEGDEIVGWQRVEALTVVEDLGESDANFAVKDSRGVPVAPAGYTVEPKATVKMRTVE